jgi:glycosyltransferase involved in cell wall biosynthesis
MHYPLFPFYDYLAKANTSVGEHVAIFGACGAMEGTNGIRAYSMRLRGAKSRRMTCEAGHPRRICFPFADRVRSVGGSHISAMTLIERLDRKRYHPKIILIGKEGSVDRLARELGQLPQQIMPNLTSNPTLVESLGIVREAARELASGKFDIVHTNEGNMHVIWGLAAKIAGVAHVWHHRGNPDAKGLRFLAPLTANQVISVSRFAAPRQSAYSAAKRCTVIHSPFDLGIAGTNRAAGRRQIQEELSLTDDSIFVGYFGHYSDRKRPLKFIEAIAAAIRIAPELPVHGLMFGEEHDPGLLRQMESSVEKLGLRNRIHLMGFRKSAETWLAGCDALLVPAVEEPFGRTLIEAMLVGTPVVAAASGGNIEAIDDGRTGLLATADDADALGQRLLAILRDKTLAQDIRSKAKEHALCHFGIDVHVRGVESVYDRIGTQRTMQ